MAMPRRDTRTWYIIACAADGVRLLAGGRLLFPLASNLTPSAAQARYITE